jgi:hypothetical protein
MVNGMPVDEELYSIVAIGQMNPRIHHPGWYQLNGLIDDAEFAEAVKGEVLVMAPMAKWQVKDFTIVCQMDRWEVQARDRGRLARLRALTSKLFDDLLTHTPISALGLNFHYLRTTSAPNVAGCLGDLLSKTQIGLQSRGTVLTEITIRRLLDGRTLNVTIRAADKDERSSQVEIVNNFEYGFSDKIGQFKLQDTILSQFERDERESEEQTAIIVRSINESLERQ